MIKKLVRAQWPEIRRSPGPLRLTTLLEIRHGEIARDGSIPLTDLHPIGGPITRTGDDGAGVEVEAPEGGIGEMTGDIIRRRKMEKRCVEGSV